MEISQYLSWQKILSHHEYDGRFPVWEDILLRTPRKLIDLGVKRKELSLQMLSLWTFEFR